MNAAFGEQSLLSVLACPGCHGALARETSRLRCESCGESFVREGGYWSLVTAKTRAAMLGESDESRRGPWSQWHAAMDGLEAWRRRQRARSLHTKSSDPASERSDGSSDDRTRALLERCVGDRDGLLVDVGAKDGRMRALAPSRCFYVGLDPAPKGDGAVLRAVAEELPIASASAITVFSHAAFDYFVEPERALDEASRALVAGGSLALVVSVLPPAVARARSAPSRAARALEAARAVASVGVRASAALVGEAMFSQPAHVHYYTREAVMGLVGARFDLVEVTEAPRASSTILYIHGRKRARSRLNVLRS
ncbi:MAG: methyltransferase domain-containing protein [Myxococcales bacterium]|nr:methyltransferase domain-containing protein [Myxococcales bacterium]